MTAARCAGLDAGRPGRDSRWAVRREAEQGVSTSRLGTPAVDSRAGRLRAARHALPPGAARPADRSVDRGGPLARGDRGVRTARACARRSRAVPRRRPTAFWRVKGAYDLTPQQAAVLQAVFGYREAQAERQDVPPFKVMGEATLLDLARQAPHSADDLRRVAGMTVATDQSPRAEACCRPFRTDCSAPALRPPRTEREPDDVRDRYDRLHTWRKNRARARGVESDVILPRTALRDLARRPPHTHDELAQTIDFGPRRREMYGDEILALLADVAPASEPS